MTKLMKTIAASPFLRGMGSVLDLAAASYPGPDLETPPAERDAAALRGDWERVGRGLWQAIETVQGESHRGQAPAAQ